MQKSVPPRIQSLVEFAQFLGRDYEDWLTDRLHLFEGTRTIDAFVVLMTFGEITVGSAIREARQHGISEKTIQSALRLLVARVGLHEKMN